MNKYLSLFCVNLIIIILLGGCSKECNGQIQRDFISSPVIGKQQPLQQDKNAFNQQQGKEILIVSFYIYK